MFAHTPGGAFAIPEPLEEENERVSPTHRFTARETDKFVRARIEHTLSRRGQQVDGGAPQPLRVAANWIGATAIRGAWLLQRLVGDGFMWRIDPGDEKRVSSGTIIEAYPTAARIQWNALPRAASREVVEVRV